ncbi:MAG: restriction endonuclease [Burkholderiales bacterium]|nr:MAG: restriction endonuclease [Burkholderiales bacterium]RPH68085.1 MAG: restriction endonuclease [Burkholderiales bacterium]
MAHNSLFAILLRSPWWISFAITAGFVVIARALLPAEYVIYGAFGAAPFLVIGCIAAWRQLRAPSTSRVAGTLGAIRAMPWSTFSSAIEDAFRRDGYVVARHQGPAADFEVTKNGRIALLSCKRWKVARTGIEPLRDLRAAKDARDAHDCIYVAVGEITDNARSFAAANGVRILTGAELVRLLPTAGRAARTRQPA